MVVSMVHHRYVAIIVPVVGIFIIAALLVFPSGPAKPDTFSPIVDEKGDISLPKGYRSQWIHLGSWAVQEKAMGLGFHDVYTQPWSVEAYKKTGTFPDGAVLVKEVRHGNAAAMTTGHVSWAGKISIWFVIIKDTKGRFPNHPNWGDGWGWALFEAKDPSTNVSKNFRTDCIPCHIPAQQTDWVYIQGYPTLKEQSNP